MERNRDLERDLLTRAASYIPDDPTSSDRYVSDVTDRLDAMEAKGHNGWDSPLSVLCAETTQEGLDIGGWGAGIDLRLLADIPDEGFRQRCRLDLIAGIAHGAMSWRKITELAERLGPA